MSSGRRLSAMYQNSKFYHYMKQKNKNLDNCSIESNISSSDDEIDIKINTNMSQNTSDHDDITIMYPANDFQFRKERVHLWAELTDIEIEPVFPKRKATHSKEADATRKRVIKPVSEIQSNADFFYAPSIEFRFQYLVITERLKVTVVKASNILGRESKRLSDISTYVEVSLMPGKIQKQVSKTQRGSDNPNFESTMFFKGLSLDEMHQMCVRIKLMVKINGHNFRSLGEVTVSLEDIDIVSETTFEENVNTRIGLRSGSYNSYKRITVN